jgi:hypothetical protein
MTKDTRNHRRRIVDEWQKEGHARRQEERFKHFGEILNRDGLIQTGPARFARIGHYTTALRGSVDPRKPGVGVYL